MKFMNIIKQAMTRRGFIRNGLIGAGAVAASGRLAAAEQLLSGKTASDIRGNGVEKRHCCVSSQGMDILQPVAFPCSARRSAP